MEQKKNFFCITGNRATNHGDMGTFSKPVIQLNGFTSGFLIIKGVKNDPLNLFIGSMQHFIKWINNLNKIIQIIHSISINYI